VVHRELINLMGPVDHAIPFRSGEVTILMLCGLQGSGKTTTCGKLARRIKEEGHGVLLVAADLQRPAAIEQLAVLGEQIGVPVHTPDGQSDPVSVCKAGVAKAKQSGASVVILDTAGRLSIDEALMAELSKIDRTVSPDQVFLVVDAMTGQDAVESARRFNEALEIDGVIMTKLDGDARGGAALSVKSVTGVPIKFIGTGEGHWAWGNPGGASGPERYVGGESGKGSRFAAGWRGTDNGFPLHHAFAAGGGPTARLAATGSGLAGIAGSTAATPVDSAARVAKFHHGASPAAVSKTTATAGQRSQTTEGNEQTKDTFHREKTPRGRRENGH
jgi:Ni2+-binding GTPase involved in maturation of urease and hydrogenase